MDNEKRTFVGGIPNPDKYGISLRTSSGQGPIQSEIDRASQLLNRDAFYVDSNGVEWEIIAATVHPIDGRILYVETEARGTDISIKINLVDKDQKLQSVDIESYNPYFGCDVGLLTWIDESFALLIYREKHWTYAYRIDNKWPPRFVKIEDRWMVHESVLFYLSDKAEMVQRLQIDNFAPLPPLSLADAAAQRCLPTDPYTS